MSDTISNQQAQPTAVPLHEYRPAKKRSMAWIYYMIITALLLVGAVAAMAPALVLAAVITGLYSRYLFRGGRLVLWIW